MASRSYFRMRNSTGADEDGDCSAGSLDNIQEVDCDADSADAEFNERGKNAFQARPFMMASPRVQLVAPRPARKAAFAPLDTPRDSHFDVWKELERFENEKQLPAPDHARECYASPVAAEARDDLFFPGDGRLLPSIRNPIYYGDHASDVFGEDEDDPGSSYQTLSENEWTQHSPLHHTHQHQALQQGLLQTAPTPLADLPPFGAHRGIETIAVNSLPMDVNPKPLKSNILPHVELSDYSQATLRMAIKLPRQGYLKIGDGNSPSAGFIRCKSNVLSHLSATAPTLLYSILSPYSINSQGGRSDLSFFARLSMHSNFALMAFVDPNYTLVHIVSDGNRVLQTLDIPSTLAESSTESSKDRLQFICHDSCPSLSWHRSSLALAVQYDRHILIFDVSPKLGNPLYYHKDPWGCRTILNPPHAAGVGWLADSLATFMSSTVLGNTHNSAASACNSDPLSDSSANTVLVIWRCEFDDYYEIAKKTAKDSSEYVERPFCHRVVAADLACSPNIMQKSFVGLESAEPTFKWDLLTLAHLDLDQPKRVKSIASSHVVNMTGAKSYLSRDGTGLGSRSFSQEDLGSTCMSLRDVQPDPTARFLAVSFGLQTEQETSTSQSVYSTVHIVYYIPPDLEPPRTTREIALNEIPDPDERPHQVEFKIDRRNTGQARAAAYRSIHRTHYGGCFRSGMRHLFRRFKQKHTDHEVMIETASLSSSSSWTLDRSSEGHVYQRAAVEKTTALNDMPNLHVCELLHPAPLCSLCWLDQGVDFDDLFTPACVTTLDINGRITIWTESGYDKEMMFEPLASYQLLNHAPNMNSVFLKPYQKFYDPSVLPITYAQGNVAEDSSSEEAGTKKSTSGLATEADYRGWWESLLKDASRDNDFLNCNVNASGNLVFMATHRLEFSQANLIDRFLRQYQYSATLVSLNAMPVPSQSGVDHVLKSSTHTEERSSTYRTNIGMPWEAQDSISFLFLLSPVNVKTPVVVLAVRNVKSQPGARVAVKVCCAREDLPIPGLHSISSIISVNAIVSSDPTNCLATTGAEPIPGISATGEFKIIGDGLLLPACILTAKSTTNSIVTYRILPQLSLISADHPGQIKSGTAKERRTPAVRYFVEIMGNLYLPVNGLGILPFNTTRGAINDRPAEGLPESSNRVHTSRLNCRVSLEIAGSHTRLLSVEDGEGSKTEKQERLELVRFNTGVITTRSVPVSSERHDLHWILSALDPNLGLPSFVRNSLSLVVNPQSVCLHHRWNFIRHMIPPCLGYDVTRTRLRSDHEKMRYQTSLLRKLSPTNPKESWQRLTPYIEAVALDSLGHVILVYKKYMCDALGLPAQSLIDLSSLTNDNLHIPLVHLVEVPLGEGFDAPYQLFLGVTAGTKKLIAFTLAMDMCNRVVCEPASLEGKSIIQSLLSAVSPTFHASSGDESIDSKVLGIFLSSTQLTRSARSADFDQHIIRLVLHLGVTVEEAEEEQILLSSLSVYSRVSEFEPQKNACVVLFEQPNLAVYLNYSEPRLLGLHADQSMSIVDLPSSDDLNAVRQYSLQCADTPVTLINSCLSLFSDTVWCTFDLLATFPILEATPPVDCSVATQNPYLPFNTAMIVDKSLVVAVYAIVYDAIPSPDGFGASSLGQLSSVKPSIVPYFLARIPVGESSFPQTSTGTSKNTKTTQIPFIMDLEMSCRTLAVLCSDSKIHIFEFRSSLACRDQHFILSGISSDDMLFTPHASCQRYIQPHYAVQVLDLSDYLNKTCRSLSEDLQIKAARYLALLNSDKRTSRLKSNGSEKHNNKRRVVTPWQRMANTLRRGGSSSRNSARLEEFSPHRMTNPSSSPPNDRIIARIAGGDLGRWLSMDSYGFNKLLSFMQPSCKIALSKTPEVLLVNWPVTSILPGPTFLSRYQSIITPARSSLKSPTTITWLPVPTLHPFLLLAMTVSDGHRPEQSLKCREINSVASSTYRQASEYSGLIWKAIPLHTMIVRSSASKYALRNGSIIIGASSRENLLPRITSQTATNVSATYQTHNTGEVVWLENHTGESHYWSRGRVSEQISARCHFHSVQWSSDPAFIEGAEKFKVSMLLSYSVGGSLNETFTGRVNVMIPSATSKSLLLERRNGPGPKHSYHPNILWSWLRIGNVPIVLYVLSHLIRPTANRLDHKKIMENLVCLPTLQVLIESDARGAAAGGGANDQAGGARESGNRAADLFSHQSTDSHGDIFEEEEDVAPATNLLDEILHGREPPSVSDAESGDNVPPQSISPNDPTSADIYENDSNLDDRAGAAIVSSEELIELREKLIHLIRCTHGFDTGDLTGWRMVLNLSGSEMHRLIGVIDFLLASRLHDLAPIFNITQQSILTIDPHVLSRKSWACLHAAVTAVDPLTYPRQSEESVPQVRSTMLSDTIFLCAVARSSFSIGDLGPDAVADDLNIMSQKSVSTDELCLGLMTDDQGSLLKHALRLSNRNKVIDATQGILWEDLSRIGAGYWVQSTSLLRELTEQLPRNEYIAATQNPDRDQIDETKSEEKALENVALFYCLTGRQNILAGLYQKAKNLQVSQFLRGDFIGSERARISAVKNAWQLVAKKRYMLALAFFVLGDAGNDAVDIAIRYMDDGQLACFIAKAVDILKPKVQRPVGISGNPTIKHVFERTLRPMADEYQDVSLLLFCSAMIYAPNNSGQYLRRHPQLLLTDEFELERLSVTVTHAEGSQQEPDSSGHVLGKDICLRRFSAFSNCPNVLSCLLPARRNSPVMGQSTLRAIAESLNRRHLLFGVALLRFLCLSFPDYVKSIPQYIPRIIISQYHALICSEQVINKFAGLDIRAIFSEWLKGADAVTDPASPVHTSAEAKYWQLNNEMFNSSMADIFRKVEKEGVAIYHTYPVLSISWLPLFATAEEFSKLSMLLEILPQAIVFAIVKTDFATKERLSLSVVNSPVLARLFPRPVGAMGNIDYSTLREMYQSCNVLRHSVDSLLQMSDVESLTIGTLNLAVTVIRAVLDRDSHICYEQMRLLICVCLQLTLIHLLPAQFLRQEVYAATTQNSREALWVLQYSVIVDVLGMLLAAFDAMFNVFSEAPAFHDDDTRHSVNESSQLQMCRGIVRLNTLAATINREHMTPDAIGACMNAILLTIAQDVILCTKDEKIVDEPWLPQTDELRLAHIHKLRAVLLQYVFLGSCETILSHLETFALKPAFKPLYPQFNGLKDSLNRFCTVSYEKRTRRRFCDLLIQMTQKEFLTFQHRLNGNNPWSGVVVRPEVLRLVVACDPVIRLREMVSKMNITDDYTLISSYMLTRSIAPAESVSLSGPQTGPGVIPIALSGVPYHFPLGRNGMSVGQCLIPYAGSPGVVSSIWSPRSFLPLLAVATNKGLKLFDLVDHVDNAHDFTDFMGTKDGQETGLLNPMTRMISQALATPSTYLWASLLLSMSERQRQKTIMRISESLPRESESLKESLKPQNLQFTLLAPHPHAGIIAGVLGKSEELIDSNLQIVVALICVQPTRKLGDINLVGSLCLPGNDSINSVTTSLGENILHRLDKHNEGKHASHRTSVANEEPRVSVTHVTHFSSATVSRQTAGDIFAVRWSHDSLWAVTEKGYVIVWRVITDLVHTQPQGLIVGRTLPLLTLHAHKSGRLIEPIPTTPGKLLFVTAGKGAGALGNIYATTPAGHASELSVGLATPLNANELLSVNRSLGALSENNVATLPVFAKACREAAGALLLWTTYSGLAATPHIPMLRPSVLLADFAFAANDHPTCSLWHSARQAIYYGTVSGCIRRLDLISRTVQCVVAAQAASNVSSTIATPSWPIRLWHCEFTNRLISVWSDCVIVVFDLTESYSIVQALDHNSKLWSQGPNSILPILQMKDSLSDSSAGASTSKIHSWQKKTVSASASVYIAPNYIYVLTTAGSLIRTVL